MNSTSIYTRSGKWFDLTAPDPALIDPEDLAVGLGNICRFVGQTPYYSVAQHSIGVAEEVTRRNRPDLAFAALLHDAHEAYLGDLSRAARSLLPGYDPLAKRIDRSIERYFRLPLFILEDAVIRDADDALLQAELWDLKRVVDESVRPQESYTGPPILGWAPDYARTSWTGAYLRLSRQRRGKGVSWNR
jgi:hypothetical protein